MHSHTLTHIHTHTHALTLIHMHTHTDTHMHTHGHTHTHMHSHIHMHTHTDTHMHSHTHAHTLTHTLTHALTHTDTHTYTHTCTHTHTHARTHTGGILMAGQSGKASWRRCHVTGPRRKGRGRTHCPDERRALTPCEPAPLGHRWSPAQRARFSDEEAEIRGPEGRWCQPGTGPSASRPAWPCLPSGAGP